MEETEVTLPFSSFVNVPADIAATSTIIEEGPRICPLCFSEVRLFFINYNEKLLMCENSECEFPFGYEELLIVKVNNEEHSDVEEASLCSAGHGSSLVTGPVVSKAAWPEIDNIDQAYDSEDSKVDIKPMIKNNANNSKKQKLCDDNKEEMEKHIEDIKELNIELHEIEDSIKGNMKCIKKQNWLKTLMNLQESSGKQLLKQEEVAKFRKNTPAMGTGELKIDINSSTNDESLIKIEIMINSETGEQNSRQ